MAGKRSPGHLRKAAKAAMNVANMRQSPGPLMLALPSEDQVRALCVTQREPDRSNCLAGEAGLRERWQGLTVEDQYSAVRLADMLGAAAVLQQWDAMLSSQSASLLSATKSIGQQLLLADTFQQQLPRFYKGCLAAACHQAGKSGGAVLISTAAEMTPTTCAALLTAFGKSLEAATADLSKMRKDLEAKTAEEAKTEEKRRREVRSHAETRKLLDEALAANAALAPPQGATTTAHVDGHQQGSLTLSVESTDTNKESQPATAEHWSLDCSACSALALGTAAILGTYLSAMFAVCAACCKAATAFLVLSVAFLLTFLGLMIVSPVLVSYGAMVISLTCFGDYYPDIWTPELIDTWVKWAKDN